MTAETAPEADHVAVEVRSRYDQSGIRRRGHTLFAFEGCVEATPAWLTAAPSPVPQQEAIGGFPPAIDGSFQLVVAEPDRLRIALDPAASRRMFYWSDGSVCAFAPEVEPLLGIAGQLELDYASVLHFLASGRFIAGRTPWVGIRQLRPGQCLTFENGRVHIDVHRQPCIDVSGATEPELLRECRRRVRHALQWRVAHSNAPALALTGGYDSRFLLCSLADGVADTTKLRTVSWGAHRGSDRSDLAIAQELAKRFGTKHLTLRRSPERVAANFERMVRAQSGMTEQAFTQADEIDIYEQLLQEHEIDGLIRGDECIGQKGAAPVTVEQALRRVGIVRLSHHANSHQWLTVRLDGAALQDRVIDDLLRDATETPIELRDRLYREERLSASIQHLAYQKSHYLKNFNPLLDATVLTFCTSLSPRQREDKTFLRRLLQREFPTQTSTPIAVVDNAPDWVETIRTSQRIRRFLAEKLDGLPEPLNRDHFRSLFHHLLTLPKEDAGGLAVAVRAVILGELL